MANMAKALREDLKAMKQQFSHRNGEKEKPTQLDNYYWIRGEALARSSSWPYKKGQRIQLNDNRISQFNVPYYITSSETIDMGNDIEIPLEWVTKHAEFYGPVIYTPPWLEDKDK